MSRFPPKPETELLGLPVRLWTRLSFIAVAAVALALPLWLVDWQLFVATYAMIYAIAVLGLSLLTGLSGQFSLGHSAFFAFGAYATAIWMAEFDLSAYLALPAAGVAAFIFGALFGLPALRLKFLYLALATYALATALPQLLKSKYLEAWTGGVQGLYLNRPSVPDGLPLSEDQWWYIVTLFSLAMLFWLAQNLSNSRSGRALRAVRDHDMAASALGVNLPLYKTMIFGVSAAITGVAGGLFALMFDFIAPDSFGFQLSILLFVGMVIGGVGSVWGALVGGIFLQFLPLLSGTVSQGIKVPALGFVLIASVWLFPRGVAGLVQDAVKRYARTRPGDRGAVTTRPADIHRR